MEEFQDNMKSQNCLSQTFSVNIKQCILEEVLHRLFILQRISNGPKATNTDKFSGKMSINKNMKSSDNEAIEKIKRNVDTFEKNFGFIESILKMGYDELGSNSTYKNMSEVIEALKKSKTDEENLRDETMRNQVELEKLERSLYEEEKFYHRKIAECMADIGKIKDKIEDFLVEGEIKIDYIDKWQNSKIEMNDISLERKEEEKTTELKKLDGDMYKESRVHQEIIAAYNEMTKDIETETENWQAKYVNDLKELDVKILALKEKREKQNEAMRSLKETYNKREKEINDYKLYKIQQEEKKLELKKRNDAATKIQAWWRGTMVRKGFGKFRKKKDKKGKKKGDKK